MSKQPDNPIEKKGGKFKKKILLPHIAKLKKEELSRLNYPGLKNHHLIFIPSQFFFV